MDVLVVPHGPLGDWWQGSRHYQLLRHFRLHTRCHIINVRPGKVPFAFEEGPDRATLTEVPLWTPRTFYRRFTSAYPQTFWMAHTQLFFQWGLRRFLNRIRPDAVLIASNHHIVGFPPRRLPARVVFDYLDYAPDFVERRYCEMSDVVAAISEPIQKRAEAYGKPTVLIPNGVDLERFVGKTRAEAKRRLGLAEDEVLVSLIGLTCSPRMYFLEAIRQLNLEGAKLRLAIVGGGPTRTAILDRSRELGIDSVIAPGALPHRETDEYFLATDVGLYPGDDVPYFQEASPLKIAEYLAAGSQVVTSPVTLFRETSAVWTASDDAAGFAAAIRAALGDPRPAPDLRAFDWRMLSLKLEDALAG